MSILEGLLFGFGTVIFIGPVFFTLLKIALDNGVKAGLLVALGIVISDVVIIALLRMGLGRFIELESVQVWLAVLGSIVLFVLGLKYIFQTKAVKLESQKLPSIFKHTGFFAKGFLVNFINPFVFFVWISILTYADKSYESSFNISLFLISALAGIFITDALKAIFASRLQRLLQPIILQRIFFIIGILLLGFGMRLVYFSLNKLELI